jgi:hypothetical protein
VNFSNNLHQLLTNADMPINHSIFQNINKSKLDWKINCGKLAAETLILVNYLVSIIFTLLLNVFHGKEFRRMEININAKR